MTDHDAADAANERHAERMATIDEQPDPRDVDPAIAAEWDQWRHESVIEFPAVIKILVDGRPSTEQEAWWA